MVFVVLLLVLRGDGEMRKRRGERDVMCDDVSTPPHGAFAHAHKAKALFPSTPPPPRSCLPRPTLRHIAVSLSCCLIATGYVKLPKSTASASASERARRCLSSVFAFFLPVLAASVLFRSPKPRKAE